MQVMVGVHLAPFPKPISSITDDFPTEQNHKGWQVGSLQPFHVCKLHLLQAAG